MSHILTKNSILQLQNNSDIDILMNLWILLILVFFFFTNNTMSNNHNGNSSTTASSAHVVMFVLNCGERHFFFGKPNLK